MLTTHKKQKVIKSVQRKDGDTGSPEVQVALLSERIDELANHLKTHKKDLHSRRGLVKMVSERRKLLAYLAKDNEKAYKAIIKKVGLKK
jgi:small subunit ribosomal protein S15